jgi:ribonucleoside-diphosphate reductase alpha chain
MDLSGSSSDAGTNDMATLLDTAGVSPGESKSKGKRTPYPLDVDHSRDALLTDFGKETLNDRYLLPGESYQDLFVRVASAYADDQAHAQRIYDYISKLWFMPATPVLSNGGTGRGLPISCFLNSVDDSLNGIVDTWNENVWLASRGGGIGTYWGSCAASASRSASTARPAASSRSCA